MFFTDQPANQTFRRNFRLRRAPLCPAYCSLGAIAIRDAIAAFHDGWLVVQSVDSMARAFINTDPNDVVDHCY